MLKIGLTGSFGAGKSFVAAMFAARGAQVIRADDVVHTLYERNKNCRDAIAKAFGTGIVGPSGVDRAGLGRIVFKDKDALARLEAIVHPYVRRDILVAIKKAGRRMVVVDAAILCEAGWHTMVDTVIVVKARRDIQITRAMARTGLSRADVLGRIRRQMPLREKMKYAAYIINNSGSPAQTEQQVERIIRSLHADPLTGRRILPTTPTNRSKQYDQRI